MISRIVSPFKEFGAAGLLYIVARGLSRFHPVLGLHYYELTAQPVADAPFIPARFKKSIEVREVARDDPAVAQMGLSDDVVAYRYGQPTVCLGAFQKGVFVASMWLCLGPYAEDEVRCTFVPEGPDVFDFGFEILPEHRGGMVFGALWDGANDYLRARGSRFTYSRVSRFNTASRQSHKRLKWQCIGRVLFLTMWRLQAMIGTVPPYLHVASTRSSGPTIRMRA